MALLFYCNFYLLSMLICFLLVDIILGGRTAGFAPIVWSYGKSDTHTIAPITKRCSSYIQTMSADEKADRMDMAMSGQVVLVIENDA